MKTIKIASALFLISSVSAFAADLPSVKSAPVAASAPMWAGFYAGINAGGTWANNTGAYSHGIPLYTIDRSNIFGNKYLPGTNAAAIGLTASLATNSSSGFLGGVQAGYNLEVYKSFVVGAETDFQGFEVDNWPGQFHFTSTPSTVRSVTYGDITTTTYTTMQASKSVSYLGTVRGRVGYIVTPNLLFYGTGGLAYGAAKISYYASQEKVDQTDELDPGSISTSKVLVGWTAGGGAEWMLAPNWTLKAEYLYYNLGGLSTSNGGYFTRVHQAGIYPVPDIVPGTIVGLVQARAGTNTIDGNIVRAGVNYHFNFASSPVSQSSNQ
ncbi:outer membrane protein [Methylocystis suflitae]|uniref:outer membrane protein n=1 Tax=Methylocystis suflitae TaxID=2951405 RepID=UPI002109DC89|nr:outer membrane beta-barrel protein [Methylocystis suflitae]MCQ4190037.1 outer membrane beta-barrel protein [Methylocystis suflitae]